MTNHKHIRFFIVIAVAALSATAHAGPLQRRAAKIAKSRKARAFYRKAPGATAKPTGSSRPGRFGFMVPPDRVADWLSGTGSPPAGHVSPAEALRLAVAMVNNPRSVTREIARSAIVFGRARHRANYFLYRKVKKGRRLTRAEAKAFIYNWHVRNIFTAGQKLLRRTAAYPKAPPRPPWNKRRSQTIAKLKKLARTLPATVTRAARVGTLTWTVHQAKVGLFRYPPYLEFLVIQRKLAARHRTALAQLRGQSRRTVLRTVSRKVTRKVTREAPADADYGWEVVKSPAGGGQPTGGGATKPTVLFFYVSWCGYCVKLNRKTFANSKVRRYVRKHYNFTIIDCTSKKRSRLMLAYRYGVRGFPTVILLDSQGRAAKRIVGYVGPRRMLAALRQVK